MQAEAHKILDPLCLRGREQHCLPLHRHILQDCIQRAREALAQHVRPFKFCTETSGPGGYPKKQKTHSIRLHEEGKMHEDYINRKQLFEH